MPMTRKKSRRTYGTRAMAVLLAVLIVGVARFALSQTMMWQSNFPSISLSSITTRLSAPEGSSTATLQLTGDAEITADNSATARLSEAGGDTLVTEYKLTFDGNGSGSTGGSTVNFTSYDSFLVSSAAVTHVGSDDVVDVTLHVRAQNQAGDLADSGSYSATQSLTVTWVGP